MKNIKIIKSKRKTIAIQVKDASEVIVRAPYRYSKKDIMEFIERNREWIDNALEKMQAQEEELKNVRTITELERSELVNSAMRVIPERVKYYAPLVGVDYGRITIRNQKTRWGSCSSAGNLNFNVALMRVPLEVLDYVVVHELCHRIELNHSKRFWSEDERVLPDYKKQKKWLSENGVGIMREVVGLYL